MEKNITAGIVVVGLGYQVLGDWLLHHPRDYPKTLAKTEVVIKEQATNWNSHKIKLEIVWSPEGKVTGRTAEKHTWHARSSREECFKVLEEIVKKAYNT